MNIKSLVAPWILRSLGLFTYLRERLLHVPAADIPTVLIMVDGLDGEARWRAQEEIQAMLAEGKAIEWIDRQIKFRRDSGYYTQGEMR